MLPDEVPLPEPVLYVLARSDLDSLNPGKLAAQACHAANVAQTRISTSDSPILRDLWEKWAADRGFGTTIVLDSPLWSINRLDFLRADDEIVSFLAGSILDPSYPLKDGAIVHHIKLTTCGYIFGDKNNPYVRAAVQGLNLYR